MTAALFLSSGDLIVDRRYQFARDLLARGDVAAATDLLEQVIEAAPDFVSAWFALGELREERGDRGGAVAAFGRARALDGEDRHGAGLRLARLGVAQTKAMSMGYVRTLFDQYASRFDAALLDGLAYRAPALLRAAIGRVGGRSGGGPDAAGKFGRVLDLGCGTGLAGEAMRPLAHRLVGVDLAPGMIAAAERKGLYDRLVTGDLVQFLAAETAANERYDLVLAADVFAYFAELDDIVRMVARILVPSGLFAFTVETHDGDGVRLGEALRYAHGETHVRAAVAAAGLALCELTRESTRNEAGSPVPGLVIVAMRN